MKRLISATLALSLLGTAAATAAPAYRGTPIEYRGGYDHRDAGNGAAIAVGVGFLALLAVVASQDHHHRVYDRGYGFHDGRDRR